MRSQRYKNKGQKYSDDDSLVVDDSNILTGRSLDETTPQLLWGTKDDIQSIPPFKWFSLLLVPVPNSSPGSS
ncbi:hypothetical protein Tco_0346420 [Tanacetum coccineum]